MRRRIRRMPVAPTSEQASRRSPAKPRAMPASSTRPLPRTHSRRPPPRAPLRAAPPPLSEKQITAESPPAPWGCSATLPPPSWSSPRSERLTAPMPSRPCVDPSEPLTRPAAASYGLSAPSPPPVPAPHAKPREESASSALGAPSLRGLGTAPPKPHIIFYMVLSIDNPHFNPLLNCYLAIFAPFHPFFALFAAKTLVFGLFGENPCFRQNPQVNLHFRKPQVGCKTPDEWTN